MTKVEKVKLGTIKHLDDQLQVYFHLPTYFSKLAANSSNNFDPSAAYQEILRSIGATRVTAASRSHKTIKVRFENESSLSNLLGHKSGRSPLNVVNKIIFTHANKFTPIK